MKKRIVGLFIAIVLIMSIGIGSAFAADAESGCDNHGFLYEIHTGSSVRYSYIDVYRHFKTMTDHYMCELCGLKQIWATHLRVIETHNSSCACRP